jgi:hypothetical protein
MAQTDRQEIQRRLWNDLDVARVQYHIASTRFDHVVKENPAGLPHRDGSLHVQQTCMDSSAALEHYLQALKRFTDFTLRGTIPDDLMPSRATSAGTG